MSRSHNTSYNVNKLWLSPKTCKISRLQVDGIYYQHESDPTPGGSGRQEGLAGCGPWGHEESDMTKRLNNNKNSSPMKGCLDLSDE